MRHRRLFRGAPEALSIVAYYVMGDGWAFTFRLRREGETWDEADSEVYSHLSTAELIDVMEVAIPTAFERS